VKGRVQASALAIALLIPGVRAHGQEAQDAPSPSVPEVVGQALLEEAKRYACDSAALATSPLRWNDRDWTMFSAFAVSFGILLATDGPTYTAIQERRSATTDDISKATTPFGREYAWAVAGAMLAGGLIARNPELRDTGRDAIEAAVFAGLMTTILKPVFGRERPEQSDGRTVFHGFTNQYKSLPSGHSTMAWAVASVVAMRAEGWIIPTVAYTLATLVSFDRVNDQKHFVSDVFMGAAIGVSVGRFVVGRHQEEKTPGVTVAFAPVPGGVGLRIVY
jgi:membrane-associated phospholipid phosphatase